MAIAIMISTFGCNNGLILAGARVYYAMARDGLFFRTTGRLNARARAGLRASSCRASGRRSWCCRAPARCADRTAAVSYGNLYGNLLDYVIFAVLIFYVLTIAGLFVLRRKQPDAERPYRAFGYPVVPALYILAASAIVLVLLLYKPQTTWPGLVIVLTGIPVYFALAPANRGSPAPGETRIITLDFGGPDSPWPTLFLPRKPLETAARGDEGREPPAPGARPGPAHHPRRRRHHRHRHLRRRPARRPTTWPARR